MENNKKESSFVDEFGGAIMSENEAAADGKAAEAATNADVTAEDKSDEAHAACTCSQCRIKSWAMWVSVLGLLGMILQHTGVFAKLGLDSETWDMIITLVGSVLTAFGIVNNPTEKKKL